MPSYLLGQGLGGIVLPPYSETFGRKNLYVWSTGFYAIFCVLIGACSPVAVGAVGRGITGMLSAIPSAVISGTTQDLFNDEERGWVVFSNIVGLQCGIGLGPIMSTYISSRMGWFVCRYSHLSVLF